MKRATKKILNLNGNIYWIEHEVNRKRKISIVKI